MSLVYTGTARQDCKIEVDIPTESFMSTVKITVIQEEKGNPFYPKSYRPAGEMEISMDREEFRKMLRCLDAVI